LSVKRFLEKKLLWRKNREGRPNKKTTSSILLLPQILFTTMAKQNAPDARLAIAEE
jgi:hypothetical protein